MKEIITQSPIQVRPNSNLSHERMLSILTSESINNLLEKLDNNERTKIDMWNTFLKHSIYDSLSSEDRQKVVTEFLEQRYKLLESNYEINRKRIVLRDDSEIFQNTVKKILSKLISEKVLFTKEDNFHICKDCSYIIAPKGANIISCPECKSGNLGNKKMNGMFMNVNLHHFDNFNKRNFDTLSSEGANRVKSSMLTLPKIVCVVKHRVHGIELEEFGVDSDLKLDPKISVSLANRVIRECGIGNITISIQGIDSLKNNVPFTLLLDSENETKFLNTSLVPPFAKNDVDTNGSLFYFPYLAMVVAGKSNKMTKNEMDSLLKQFSKTKNKLASCMFVLNKLGKENSYTNLLSAKKELKNLSDSIRNEIKNGNFGNVVEEIQKFIFEWISRYYINECKKNECKPDSELILFLENILSPIYIK